jgi:stage IV sporulation protein FB
MPSSASIERPGKTAAAKVPEPLHTRLELRFGLFGTPVRVTLLYWVASAALGIRYYADPEMATIGWFFLWLAMVLVSVLVHELGHVLVGRLFGMRGQVVLSGLGGLTLGIDELPRRWQRILVLLGGPLAGALIVAGVWGFTFLPPPPAAWGPETALAIGVAAKGLLAVNVFWTAINLVPLWPLDGGRVACEIGEGLFGTGGTKAALVLCLATTLLCTLLATALLSLHLGLRFAVPLHVPEWLRETQMARLWHLQYGLLILYCYLLWIRTFRALWPDAQDREMAARS